MHTKGPEVESWARPKVGSTPNQAQSVAAAVGMVQGIVNAMGILADEEDPPPTTTAGLTGDRLGELMASNPRLTDGRIAELGHLFRDATPSDVPDPAALSDGVPDDYEPGHED